MRRGKLRCSSDGRFAVESIPTCRNLITHSSNKIPSNSCSAVAREHSCLVSLHLIRVDSHNHCISSHGRRLTTPRQIYHVFSKTILDYSSCSTLRSVSAGSHPTVGALRSGTSVLQHFKFNSMWRGRTFVVLVGGV